MGLEEDRKFQEFVLDRVLPIDIALEQVDGVRRNYNNKCYCPFHENFDTPSAHLYKTENGTHLMCFSERRVYRPHDVFRLKLVKTTLSQAFGRIWKQLNDQSREYLENQFGKPVNSLPKGWLRHLNEFEMFMRGEVSLQEHLLNIVKALREKD